MIKWGSLLTDCVVDWLCMTGNKKNTFRGYIVWTVISMNEDCSAKIDWEQDFILVPNIEKLRE